MTNPLSNISLFHADRPREDIQRGRGGSSVPSPKRPAVPPGADEAAGYKLDLTPAPPSVHYAPRGADTPLPLVVRVLLWLAAIIVLGGLVVAWIN
ncbi:hypothetical protein [Ancylobacter defluvii]|uniref:Uncharacterized protein n=1 Tax=Ancylobacter defluvii TaxID=1282440 RepID=A0A9W6JUC5_9HYPH|nr:hypothetical protein [Ancylobacter defluvii]MBS7588631.1 hypothetical protein [Ancylobacter defluvii]GLK83911.1 hypothetical protein GCM10017653_19810 [Ancylobacter defluvii]